MNKLANNAETSYHDAFLTPHSRPDSINFLNCKRDTFSFLINPRLRPVRTHTLRNVVNDFFLSDTISVWREFAETLRVFNGKILLFVITFNINLLFSPDENLKPPNFCLKIFFLI